MIHLQPNGRYRGPSGPNPSMTRAQRETELKALLQSRDGCDIIVSLWKEAEGIHPGECGPVGTLVRCEMIPAILRFEYGT